MQKLKKLNYGLKKQIYNKREKMKNFITKEEAEKRGICTCECHIKGLGVLHFMPCCENTYEVYINKDDNVDVDKYNSLNNQDSKSKNLEKITIQQPKNTQLIDSSTNQQYGINILEIPVDYTRDKVLIFLKKKQLNKYLK